jgi:hypothetical protein
VGVVENSKQCQSASERRTRDCVAHMASVYDVISHPAFSRSLNSLLIVPLVAKTRDPSAFAMKTPVDNFVS